MDIRIRLAASPFVLLISGAPVFTIIASLLYLNVSWVWIVPSLVFGVLFYIVIVRQLSKYSVLAFRADDSHVVLVNRRSAQLEHYQLDAWSRITALGCLLNLRRESTGARNQLFVASDVLNETQKRELKRWLIRHATMPKARF